MWLKIQAEQRQYLKVTWGNRNGPHPVTYTIGVVTAERVGGEVRDCLKRLMEWSCTRERNQLPSTLHRLAEAGQRLRYVLFDPVDGVQRPNVEILEQWISAQYQGGDRQITISTDAGCHIPWALVFDGDSQAVSEDASSLKEYTEFWAIKYSPSVVFTGLLPDVLGRPRGRESLRLLWALNRLEFDCAQQDLDPIEKQVLADLLQLPVGPAYNVEGCEQLIDQARQKDTVLHFFGHCQNTALDLGDDERIDVLRFKMMLNKLTDRKFGRPASGYSLVFLNACETAIGDLDYGFLTATAQPGLCGFVGTEVQIPRDFAIRFGLDFLQSLVLKGLSLRETMDHLRDKHWPLGLLYGNYAYPDYKIEPVQADELYSSENGPAAIK